MAGLITVSVLLGKKVRIHEIDDDLVHSSSMGAIISAPTGYRKSEIFKKMGKPLFEYEEELQSKWEKDKSKNKVVVDALQAEISKRKRKAAKGDRTSADIERDTFASIDLQMKIDELIKPRPMLLLEDTTEEKLVRVLNNQNCEIGIFSDDGRNAVRNITGIRKQDGSGENLYLKGFTNGDYVYSRVGVNDDFPDIVLRRICLNAFVFIQPDMMLELINSKGFSESGLAARLFLQAISFDPVVLMKKTTGRKIDQNKLDLYYKVIQQLTLDVEEPVEVYLTEEARAYWKTFNDYLADRLRDTFLDRYDLINKAMTLTVKMATVFLALEDGELLKKSKHNIPVDIYYRACQFVLYLIQENLKMSELFHEERLMNMANNFLKSLQKKNIQTFKPDYAFRNKQSKERREILDDLIQILVDYGHIEKDGDYLILV